MNTSTNKPATPDASRPPGAPLPFFVGTYTGPASRGIYRSALDPLSGALHPFELAAECENPSFLALHPNGRFVYAVGEVGDFGGERSGCVAAYAIADGALAFLNRQPSGGSGPCHASVDPSGRCVLVANYGSGSAAVLPILPDGSLAPPSCAIQHHGSSVNPARQEGPHAHAAMPDPSGRFALVPDLGLDKVIVYRLDAAAGMLTPNQPPAADVAPGLGPRHVAFHPGGRFVFLVNEMGCSVTAFAWDAERGSLREIQAIPTLPAEFGGVSHCAEILGHPSGRFLYASNRGHDSIAVFAVDDSTGQLTSLGTQPTLGATPRGFGIDPAGNWLIAANQDSNTLAVFSIHPETGLLDLRGVFESPARPVCVRFDGGSGVAG